MALFSTKPFSLSINRSLSNVSEDDDKDDDEDDDKDDNEEEDEEDDLAFTVDSTKQDICSSKTDAA